MKIKDNAFKLFNLIFLIAFILIGLGSIFLNQSIIKHANPVYLIAMIFIMGLILLFLYRFWTKKKEISSKAERKYCILLFIILLFLQILCAYYLAVKPAHWDFKTLFESASLLAKGKEFDVSYFEMCGNNIFPMLFLALIFKGALALGIQNLLLVGIVLNIIVIDASIFCLYKVVKKLFNKGTALFALSVCMIFMPLYGYISIFYTDTLAMIFPVLLFYLYLKMKDKETIKKKIPLFLLFGFIGFFAYQMKAPTLIVVIAIFIHMFLSEKGIQKLYLPISFVLIVGVLSFTYLTVVNRTKLFPFNVKEKHGFPATHYVMMGLTSRDIGPYRFYGIFNPDVVSLTLSKESYEDRVKLNLEETKNRIQKLGPIKFPGFLYFKTLANFGDGTFYAPAKLSIEPIRGDNSISKMFYGGEKSFNRNYYVAQGIHHVLMLCMIIGSFLTFKRKEKTELDIIRLSIFGMLCFLLLWEARSRYLVCFIPIFIIAAMPAFSYINTIYEKLLQKGKKRKQMYMKKNKKEKEVKEKDSKKTGILLFLGILFVFMFVMNYYSIFGPDDYNYSHIPWTNIRVENLGMIITSQMKMYMEWSGRLIFSGLGQLFLLIGKVPYSIINTLAFLALIYIISIFFERKTNYIMIVMTFFLLWVFTPTFAENYIWLSGSVNYLWPVLACIFFVYLFYHVYIKKDLEKKNKNSILLILSAFVAGLSHEMTFFFVGAFGFLVFVFHFKEMMEKLFQKKDKVFIGILLAFIVGGSILILSPGSFSRAGNGGLSFSTDGIVTNLYEVRYLILINIGICLYLSNKDPEKRNTYCKYMYLPIVIALLPMLIIREFSLRMLLMITVALLIPIVSFIYDKTKNTKQYHWLYIILTLLILYEPCKVALFYGNNIKTYEAEKEFLIQSYQKEKKQTFVINDLDHLESIPERFILDKSFRPTAFSKGVPNVYFCRYYGCKEVYSKKAENILVVVKTKEKSDVQLEVEGSTVSALPPYTIEAEDVEEFSYKHTFEIHRKFATQFKIKNVDKTQVEEVKIYDTDAIRTKKLDEIKFISEGEAK